jgi:hypothetical protein
MGPRSKVGFMSIPSALDAALKRLSAAIDHLDAAADRRARADAARGDLEEELAIDPKVRYGTVRYGMPWHATVAAALTHPLLPFLSFVFFLFSCCTYKRILLPARPPAIGGVRSGRSGDGGGGGGRRRSVSGGIGAGAGAGILLTKEP